MEGMRLPHQLTHEQIYQRFETSDQGLTQDQVKKKLKTYGPNQIKAKTGHAWPKILVDQFISPLVIILILASIVSFLIGETKDAVVILVIVLINGSIGFFQEIQAAKSIASLKNMIKLKTQVLREGKLSLVDSRDLVPGDVVHLQAGNKIPADIRLIQAQEAYLDESILTGESVPVHKHSHTIAKSEVAITEQSNTAFAGTLLVKGMLEGVVVETGNQTVIGQITKSVSQVHEEELPIQLKISSFSKKIVLITLGGSLMVLVIGLIYGFGLGQIFRDMVAVFVAAIPEGLPIVVTVTLAIGVQRMAKSKSIIRHLPAVETLGSTTVIGTDKTGTLTKNEMTVTEIIIGSKTYQVTGDGYTSKGAILENDKPVKPSPKSKLYQNLKIGVLCNESSITLKNSQATILGDPTEGALFLSALKAGIERHELLKQYQLVSQKPFDSDNAYMASLYSKNSGYELMIKGAPEAIISKCKNVDQEKLKHQIEELSQQGLRVLAFASKKVGASQAISERALKHGFTFYGLQAMIDPPRDQVKHTISDCHRAGIRVLMITGDHAHTARAIAHQVGIISDDKSEVITGDQIQTIDDDQLDKLVTSVSVFARVAPNDKLRIVEALKRNQEVVAVTGDGVNDAPALKSAHIGVAMGKSGTDAARDAADMIIVDDNFTSIVKAVEQGRIVFDNLRKVTLYLIPTGIAAIITVLICMLLGLPIPYTPLQLLWINLVASGLQDIALGFEPGDGTALHRKPIPLKSGIFDRVMLRRTMLVGGVISLGVIGLYTEALRNGLDLDQARTLAMTATVMFQFFQVWNARSTTKSVFRMPLLSNPFLFVTMIVSFFAQVAVLYLPAFQYMFDTVGLTIFEWILLSFIASSVIFIVEFDKAVLSKLKILNSN